VLRCELWQQYQFQLSSELLLHVHLHRALFMAKPHLSQFPMGRLSE
jgi:hypothetical protein